MKSKLLLLSIYLFIISLNVIANDNIYGINQDKIITRSSDNSHNIVIYVYSPSKISKEKNYIYNNELIRNEYSNYFKKRLGEKCVDTLINQQYYFSRNAEIEVGKFPVVYFTAGLSWSTLEYSYLIHKLVESGIVVIAINNNYTSPILDLNDSIGTWLSTKDKYLALANDIEYVYKLVNHDNIIFNKYLSNIDKQNQNIVGHSLGGASSLLASSDISDLNYCINLDGDLMESSLESKPKSKILFINQIPEHLQNSTFNDFTSDKNIGWRYTIMKTISNNSISCDYIGIKNMYHSNFQDFALILNLNLIDEKIRNQRFGLINGTYCLKIASSIIINKIKNKDVATYPEVIIHKVK